MREVRGDDVSRARVEAGDLSICLVTLRRPKELGRTLASLGTVDNVRVILNGAARAEYRGVIADYPWVDFTANERNLGVAAG